MSRKWRRSETNIPEDCTEQSPHGEVDRRRRRRYPASDRRNRYRFPPGTQVVWLERDGDLIPKPLLSVEQPRGRFKGGELTVMLLEERARDRKHEDG